MDYLLVDFTDLNNVKELIDEEIVEKNRYFVFYVYLMSLYNASFRFFDVVILNAGVLLPNNKTTADRLETTLQVNYVAQYFLIKAIIKHQKGKRSLKVLTLTSVMYR